MKIAIINVLSENTSYMYVVVTGLDKAVISSSVALGYIARHEISPAIPRDGYF